MQKYTSLQVHKYRHKYTITKYINTQVHKDTRHRYTNTVVKKYKSAQVRKYTSAQVQNNTRTQVHYYTITLLQ